MKIERDGKTYELTGAELKQAADECEREYVYLDIRDEFEIQEYIDEFLQDMHLDKYEMIEEMLDLYYYRKENWFQMPTIKGIVDSVLDEYEYYEYIDERYGCDI